MLTITETPHYGPSNTWTADSREAFCLAVLRANPRAGDLDPDADYDEIVSWLRSELRDLTIEES